MGIEATKGETMPLKQTEVDVKNIIKNELMEAEETLSDGYDYYGGKIAIRMLVDKLYTNLIEYPGIELK